MLALVLFLITWLGAGVALGSASAGMAVAASITFWWSVGTTLTTAAAGALVIGWGGLRGGPQGIFIMTLAVAAVLILWSGLGILASHLITLGGLTYTALGIVCWVISIIAQVVSGVGFGQVISR